jgi:hypothetical protein
VALSGSCAGSGRLLSRRPDAPDRWPGPAGLDRVWSAPRPSITVVDVGFCLVTRSRQGPGRGRNAAAHSRGRGQVIAVADAWRHAARVAWPGLISARTPRPTLVRNRAGDRGGWWGRGRGGRPVRTVPRDDRALASCWARGLLGEGAAVTDLLRARAGGRVVAG